MRICIKKMKKRSVMVELTIDEVKHRLMQFSEVDVIELLDLTSEDILDRFEDIIEERYEILIKEIQ
jgi:hypothetical protein